MPSQRQPRAANPQPYAVTIEKTGNTALDNAIQGSSTLISLAQKAPVGPFALVTRAQEDASRFETALHSFGYYKGQAQIRVAGLPLDDPHLVDQLEQAPAQPPVRVVVHVDPGPLFHIRKIMLQGAVPSGAEAKLQLSPGDPAVASNVLAAGARLLAALRDMGYALAKVGDPVATLVPSENALDVAFNVDPGPRVDLGPITIKGLKDVNESFVRRQLRVHQGELYNPAQLEKARQDLASLGVFSVVRLRTPDQVDAQGQLPVEFDVTEGPKHVVSFSIAYSTDLGFTTSAKWQDRNLFGNAEQLSLSAGFQGGGTAVVSPGYNVTGQFIKPDFLARDQSLQFDASALKQNLIAYDQTAVLGDVLLNRKLSDHWSGSIGIAAEWERIFQVYYTRYYTLVQFPVTAKFDNTNSVLDPTDGLRVNASVAPTQSFGHTSATFLLTQVTSSTYLDLSSLWGAKGRTVIALRGTVGDAAGATQFALPPDKRFYAGGSATVRGYRYQSIGPQFYPGRPEGGTALAAGTVEYRQRILSNYGFAAFVDAGAVPANGPPFADAWRIGAGLGGRYYTPIGPIRVDVAFPLTPIHGSDAFELYIGIGQAF